MDDLFPLKRIPRRSNKKRRYLGRHRASDGNSCLYAIGAEGEEFTKIGFSAAPFSRMAALQTSHPKELMMICFVEGELGKIKQAEALIHRALKREGHEGIGEWWDVPRPHLVGVFKRALAHVGCVPVHTVGDPAALVDDRTLFIRANADGIPPGHKILWK